MKILVLIDSVFIHAHIKLLKNLTAHFTFCIPFFLKVSSFYSVKLVWIKREEVIDGPKSGRAERLFALEVDS